MAKVEIEQDDLVMLTTMLVASTMLLDSASTIIGNVQGDQSAEWQSAADQWAGGYMNFSLQMMAAVADQEVRHQGTPGIDIG